MLNFILAVNGLTCNCTLFTGSYTLPFLLAGVWPIVGSIVMCLIRFVKDSEDNGEIVVSNGELASVRDSLTDPKWQHG